MSIRSLFKTLLGEDFHLPLLSDAYDVADDEFIEIGMDDSDLTYWVSYPSGLSREFNNTEDLHRELARIIPNFERREEMIRYATNWRSTAYFPSLRQQFVRLPDNRIIFGQLGASRLQLTRPLMALHLKYNCGGGT